MAFGTDEILWYNNGAWGQLGYACPNFGANPTTLNTTIAYLVSVMGRNLQSTMINADADLRTPPSINTLTRVHKQIVRARQILAGRALPPNQTRMEPVHATPAPTPFLIYPTPFWQVRNSWMKEWGGLILMGLTEAMQHTENRIELEITTNFAGVVGQYLQRVYVLMATELFGVADADASKPDFTLSDAQIASYDPNKFFTSTELIDTAPPASSLPTELDLRVLTDGIPASMLVGLSSWPTGATLTTPTTTVAGSAPASGGAAAAAAPTAAAFVSPPGP